MALPLESNQNNIDKLAIKYIAEIEDNVARQSILIYIEKLEKKVQEKEKILRTLTLNSLLDSD